jgi:two-component system, OmpR family, response regulator
METPNRAFAAGIVVVDPDPASGALVDALVREGFRASRIGRGLDARRLAVAPVKLRPALVVLELILPDSDGVAVCAHLTKHGVPVIVRSASRRRCDPTLVLHMGAEDFVTKTVGLEELMARIRRVLHHHASPARLEPAPAPPSHLQIATITLDDRKHRVQVGDRSVRLSASDYAIFSLLAARPECPVPPRAIAAELWPAAGQPDRRTLSLVPSCVYHLRRRLLVEGLPFSVHNVRGFGYALMPRGA